MNARKVYQTIDTHTEGQMTRHVVGGMPYIPGNTMSEKMLYMRDHEDWFRTFMTCEPRGAKHWAATLLTAPCTPGTDVGVLYYEPLGWLPMCGHDTIGVGTVLVETGMVKVTEPYTYVNLDTPAGVIRLKICVEGGRAKEVSFTNAPAFVLLEDAEIETEEYGKVVVNVCFGGNFYAIVPAACVGLDICPENYYRLIEAGDILKDYTNKQLKVVHPEKSFISGVSHVQFTGPPKNPRAYSQNAVICTPGGIDRSPCGTGTSARCALLYKKGEIGLNVPFYHESIVGAMFKCQAVEEANISGVKGIVPEVTGRAYIMSMSTVVLDPEDPFKDGFLLG